MDQNPDGRPMKVDLERKLALFEAARELTDPARRRAFLKAACRGDTTLMVKIEKLVSAGERVDDFFADCIPDPATISAALESRGIAAPADWTCEEHALLGSTIGSYQLIQKIGEGGCGAVYMAEQLKPVRRRVALKVIKLGMDTMSVIAQFEAERQALAMMEHPNIAHVFDAGATETGRPYFVMELVNGVKLTEYCDENRVGIEQRLELFIQVCHAIQHAHQKGIIHRDIKPSNILITMHDRAPVPKVIDFGIAKATEERLPDQPLVAASVQLIGTPAYMSPEQMETSGLDIDTRSDIYSLGVLLYELLTGTTPFDSRDLLKSGVDEMRRTLMEEDPQSPSSKLHTLRQDDLTRTAIQRQVRAPRLAGRLRGDLDWIVMKALEKDRTHRYETADALATDVRHYLDHEPILARPPTRWYLLRKLVRRNRILFASTAAVSAALIIGTVTSTCLYIKERAAEREQTALRREAEVRERLTQAGLLAAQQQFDAAEKLLPGIDLSKPSLELANLLRSLGDWHALSGQWPQAVGRFQALVQADQPADVATSTTDYSELAAALIETGDASAYERLRHDSIARYGTIDNPTTERILRNNLLQAPDAQLLKNLQPLDDTLERSLAKYTRTTRTITSRTAWLSMSLALMDYRRGDYPKAVQLCQQSLTAPRLNPAGNASANIILAMSCWQMNQKPLALSQWSTGAALIDAKFQKGLTYGNGDIGFWFDWVIARALAQECQHLFSTADPSGTLSPQQPTKDTSATWRALGEWHALRGEWRAAADCYTSSLRLDQFDSWKDFTGDQLLCGLALVEANDTAGYESFRAQEIARFKHPTENVIPVTTLLLKSCLLRPADPKLLAALDPMAQDAAAPFPGRWNPQLYDYYDGWRSISMGLFEYRRGNFAKAVQWSRSCLGCTTDIRSRIATARVILAMSLHQLGQDDEARSELLQARNIINYRFSTPLDHGSADRGTWHEWIIARTLLGEATAALATPPAKGAAGVL